MIVCLYCILVDSLVGLRVWCLGWLRVVVGIDNGIFVFFKEIVYSEIDYNIIKCLISYLRYRGLLRIFVVVLLLINIRI